MLITSGGILKMLHQPFSSFILGLGLLLSVSTIAGSITLIHKLHINRKWLWTTMVILLNGIGPLVFLIKSWNIVDKRYQAS